jgi:urease accessory protein
MTKHLVEDVMIQAPGRKTVQLSAALAAALFAIPAFAHPGLHHMGSFSVGLAHPLTGWDHLLAMLAVGLWASQQRRVMALALPIAFPLVMILGALAAVVGYALPAAEGGIAASVLVLGLLVAFAVKLPAWGGLPVVALFAAAHGYAHGLEVPMGGDFVSFGGGFVVSTALLHVSGLIVGRFIQGRWASIAVRLIGAGIATGGAFLLAAI